MLPTQRLTTGITHTTACPSERRRGLHAVAASDLASTPEDRAMKHRMTTLLTMFGSVALLTSVICAKPVALYVWNASESAPLGLYRLQPVDTLFVTELVAVLPPEPLAAFLAEGSYLPRGVPMLKRVLALPGQTVCRNGLTITVDGIGLGEALDRDRRGRPLPIWQGCRVVARDDVFLMNWQSSDSLDGRYFGPIPASAIIARALPIWTDGEN